MLTFAVDLLRKKGQQLGKESFRLIWSFVLNKSLSKRANVLEIIRVLRAYHGMLKPFWNRIGQRKVSSLELNFFKGYSWATESWGFETKRFSESL